MLARRDADDAPITIILVLCKTAVPPPPYNSEYAVTANWASILDGDSHAVQGHYRRTNLQRNVQPDTLFRVHYITAITLQRHIQSTMGVMNPLLTQLRSRTCFASTIHSWFISVLHWAALPDSCDSWLG